MRQVRSSRSRTVRGFSLTALGSISECLAMLVHPFGVALVVRTGARALFAYFALKPQRICHSSQVPSWTRTKGPSLASASVTRIARASTM